ncbi:glycosyltransferase family 4 protein [Halobacteriovorax marinus]|nr:MraY family glycosyltransferase [Halobacteriovorax marinus]
MIPSIIKIAKLKHLFDEPDGRKKHKSSIPTLGGIAIFASFLLSTNLNPINISFFNQQYIFSSLAILFFIGIEDDILNTRARKKLVAQIISSLILIFFADIRLSSLHGVFNIYEIPYSISVIITLITIIGITNALNLIDGIDTLAASIGIFSTLTFGSFFLIIKSYHYSTFAFSLLGSLLAFLYYNRTPARIFMGDTGSLILGMMTSIFSIKAIELSAINTEIQVNFLSSPAIVISILIVPIADTLRVLIIRLTKGVSPFSPDRNHFHHILTDCGLSHHQSTALLVTISAISLLMTYYFQDTSVNILITLNILYIALLTRFFSKIKKKGVHRKASSAL